MPLSTAKVVCVCVVGRQAGRVWEGERELDEVERVRVGE